MSLHKARPQATNDPVTPRGVVLAGGRSPVSHGDVSGPASEKEKVKEFHESRKHTKEVAKKTFDAKTGNPKVEGVDFGPDPTGDAVGSVIDRDNPQHASPEEVKKNAEAEKKQIEAAAKAKADADAKAKADAEAKAKAEKAKAEAAKKDEVK